MSMIAAKGQAKSAQLDIKVIRADGTVEDYGTVAYWHRNPLRRLAWKLRRAMNGYRLH